jgi:predicted nucleic acid-binding protein
MALLVLDSGGVSCLARRSREVAALLAALRREGAWPPLVPSEVLVETLTGDPRRDANTNSLLKTCDVHESLPVTRARRAASLRAKARRGSAVDAIVVATAEPGGTVLTSDPGDLAALAEFANGVAIEAV